MPLALIAPLLGLLLNLPLKAIPLLVLSMLAGTPAVSFVAAIGASLTLGLRRSGLLLALLVLPLYVPVLIFGVATASAAITGPASPWPPLLMLCALSLASIVLAPLAARRPPHRIALTALPLALSCLPKRASGKPASSSSSAARTEKCQSVGNVIGLGKIKDGNGDFFQLTGLIKAALAESSWNLPRNVRKQIEVSPGPRAHVRTQPVLPREAAVH